MRFFLVGLLFLVFQGGFISYGAVLRMVPTDRRGGGGVDTLVQDGFELVFIQQDMTLDTAVTNKLKAVFFEVYPPLVATFNPAAVRRVTLAIDTAYDGVDYEHEGRVGTRQAWWAKKPGDVEVVPQEVMNIVQATP